MKEHLLLFICLALAALAALLVPGFATAFNLGNLGYNLLPLLILAIGQTFVILTAGIDLSVSGTVALASVGGAWVMSSDGAGLPLTVGLLAMLAVGVAVGLFNGAAVVRLGMPPFMVTLTTMMLFSGVAVYVTASQNIYNLPEAFVNLPYVDVLGIGPPVLAGLAFYLLAAYVLRRSLLGHWVYAVGTNPVAARISGVDARTTLVAVYVISGLAAGLAAFFYTARLETGSPVMGRNVLLDVIGAVVIGGTSLFGGRGRLLWTLYGALFIVLLDNVLNLLGLSYFLIMVAKGTVILLAAVAYVLRDRQTLAAGAGAA